MTVRPHWLIIWTCWCTASLPTAAMSYFPFADLGPIESSAAEETRQAPAGKADRVVVKKAERRLYLMRDGQALQSYEIALGFQPLGHKAREGDGRTPEGRYVLDRRNDRSRFYKALHISYPNPRDRLRAEHRDSSPGGMILIHGQPSGPSGGRDRPTRIEGDWTLGCIAVSNREIEEIWSLTADGTPIEILP
jgi:murein L,D-transpeptidase YafK